MACNRYEKDMEEEDWGVSIKEEDLREKRQDVPESGVRQSSEAS